MVLENFKIVGTLTDHEKSQARINKENCGCRCSFLYPFYSISFFFKNKLYRFVIIQMVMYSIIISLPVIFSITISLMNSRFGKGSKVTLYVMNIFNVIGITSRIGGMIVLIHAWFILVDKTERIMLGFDVEASYNCAEITSFILLFIGTVLFECLIGIPIVLLLIISSIFIIGLVLVVPFAMYCTSFMIFKTLFIRHDSYLGMYTFSLQNWGNFGMFAGFGCGVVIFWMIPVFGWFLGPFISVVAATRLFYHHIYFQKMFGVVGVTETNERQYQPLQDLETGEPIGFRNSIIDVDEDIQTAKVDNTIEVVQQSMIQEK